MRVRNVHERAFAAPADRVGALIDTLAGDGDCLWPHDRWPAMRFDRPLAEGAEGGHGPIRYRVERYAPGAAVRFRFTSPPGFDGTHGFSVEAGPEGGGVLRHTVEMRVSGSALLTWPLVFGPLHDALLEDSLDRAGESLGLGRAPRRWSTWVRFLRRLLRGRRAGR